MKKLLLMMLCSCCSFLFTAAQNITNAEYFIDSDPGNGNGTALNVGVSGATVNFTATVPLGSLSAGFHFVAIRTKDADGKWGLFESRGFYISTATSNVANIIAAEYFIDTDPGNGNATAIAVSAGSTVPFTATVPLGSLASGFHFIAIRTKDADGKWGLFETRGFYISTQSTNVSNIVAAEYFYDTDPGFGSGTAIAISTATSFYQDSLLLPVGSLPLGNHSITLRVKNAEGKWSLLESKFFNLCTRNGPLSKTNYHIENNRVFFTNTSTDNDTTLWKFGDGATDTVLNPIKTYAAAGNYNLQLISKNICGADTLRKLIRINGMHFVNSPKAGNNGVATVIFEGNGFTASTAFKLQKGAAVILPADKKIISSNRVIGYFNLTGADTGRYDAIANLGGGSLDTLKNGFTISAAKPTLVSMVKGGRNPARTGFMLRLMSLQNQGNEDAIMLPFASMIGYKPGTITIASMESFVDLANKGIFQNTLNYLSANSISSEVMSAVDIDTTRKKQLLVYYRVKVPAESYITNYYRINNSSGLLSYENSSLVYPPLFKSSIVLNDIAAPNARDCMNSFLKKAVKKNIVVTISDAAWNACFNTAFDTLAKSVRDIVKDISQQNKSIPMKSVYSTLLVQMSLCSASGMPASLTSTEFEKIIRDVTFNWLYLENIDSIGRPCIDTTETLVFRQQTLNNKGGNEIKDLSQRTEDDDCPGGAFFPELFELCQPFLEVCGKVDELGDADEKIFNLFGKKIFDKFLTPFENACKVNSANAFCEKLCELTAVDPNVKYGPGNNTNLKHVNFLHNYGYTIFFENLATATAPAAYVEVTDTLDMTKLDINTFQTSGFGWGDSVAFTDANRGDYSLLKDLQPGKPNKLRVDVRIDTTSGIVKWKFSTLDPVTLQLTDDPTEGFLPPNINGVEGAGYVSFSIKAKAGVTTGAVINNNASIIFDQNAAILTPVWQHIVDTTKPQSQVAALPAIVNTPNFVVNWGGSDAHAGIDKFAVYVSINDSIFKNWKKFTTALTDTFHGQFNKTYKFFSVAVDKAGNFEEAPFDPYLTPDAITSVQIALPISLLSFDARKSAEGKKADLQWVTTFEQNVSRFEIQRSADGVNFTTIGVVNALNAINGSNYSWQDIAPLLGVNYYRLRMVDTDASSKMGPVKTLRFGEKQELLVFPTLTSNIVFIQSPKEVNAQLINMLGEVLQQKVVRGSSSLDLSGLPSGAYIVRIKGEKQVFKIMKQ
jgi:PKD repeat protein